MDNLQKQINIKLNINYLLYLLLFNLKELILNPMYLQKLYLNKCLIIYFLKLVVYNLI